MRRSAAITAALLLAAPLAGAQSRQSDRSFRWEGTVAAGNWLYVRNLNGAIRVDRATGNRIEITAEKTWRRGDPDDVRIEVTERSGNVVVCAIWIDITECDEDGYDMRRRGRRNENNDVAVEFTVRLPQGVRLGVSTVNGALEIAGATSTVEASTVNGEVVATSSGGPVQASTVNGGIEVRMGELGEGDLEFSTVNGSIEVYVPESGLNAEVEMRTVNGRVGSDFPLTVQGRINPRRIRATIGNGGRRIELSTVNGSVELRRR